MWAARAPLFLSLSLLFCSRFFRLPRMFSFASRVFVCFCVLLLFLVYAISFLLLLFVAPLVFLLRLLSLWLGRVMWKGCGSCGWRSSC